MNRLLVYRNCFTGDISGGDTHMSGLLGWLIDARPDIEAILLLPKNDGQDKAYPEVAHMKTITHPDNKAGGSTALMYILRAIRAASRINRLVQKNDVLVASSHFLPDVLPVAFARAPKNVKVTYIHHIIQDMERPPGLQTTLANWQEKLCFALIRRRFGKIIVVNQAVASRLREHGFRSHDILLSSNFVQPLSPPRPYAKKDITLAFCGRMVAQKGVDDFIAVCRVLGAATKNFKAVMIGVGPELSRLKKEIVRHKLTIDLVGHVDDATKYELLSRSKLFVFPSVEEGWGIVIAEALAAGTPVVAYDLPIYKEVFGDAIHTVPLKHRAELQQTAAELLQDYASQPASYKAQQQRSIEYAAQFRLEEVVSKELAFMKE